MSKHDLAVAHQQRLGVQPRECQAGTCASQTFNRRASACSHPTLVWQATHSGRGVCSCDR